MERFEPTKAQLEQALEEARCPLDLDTAMRDAALRICLINTVLAANLRKSGSGLTPRELEPLSNRLRRMAGRTDWRARAANDD